jgi:hypothetical protein
MWAKKLFLVAGFYLNTIKWEIKNELGVAKNMACCFIFF